MTEVRIDNESDLIAELRESKAYKDFQKRHLPRKIEREEKAWKLIQHYKGNYSRETLNRIFDTVDPIERGHRWFGSLLATPNRNLFFESTPDRINEWITELLFSGHTVEKALDICLKDLKLKGASKGLATLLLYLSKPSPYNVWVNKTATGLVVLNRINSLRGNDWGANYSLFNQAAINFRDTFGFQPQEIDWILTFVTNWIAKSESDHFYVESELTEAPKVVLTVDDRTDEPGDIVGQPMELRVMRWTPTNEMGVVALFVEFRKELGFPIIEIIRMGYPDAAVFQNSRKGHVRKYIEFEFKSSGFKAHLKDPRKCDYVVCWEHDWKACPQPVIELSKEIPAILAK
jgi:hypothetical protein